MRHARRTDERQRAEPTPFAENGGEARALAAMILCWFEPPAQQVEFTDPQTGKRYRVDFLWRTRDGRIVVVELDELVKYRDPQMMDGRCDRR
ncbi:hypothetical protein [Bifidobacterium pseudolongum]|uniref:hypothetical protein n=1 Tax=Bifidobacterium pseudolongum TaxID=1694 RepID=UPI001022660B|nr:hypothetical protein [Bifidobacterium pseudolongum]RYQ08415.1 hypothetical protein PG2105B_0199 [Bifidobacterium pseudolongum subsp. globosum]